MGEVYLARDSRLERDVAIKVLPTSFAPGSEQLAQFEHEARLLASLNHSNICAIYDIGSEGGVSFIVMEQLQGETLAARIGRGPIASNVALRYAIQIADALKAAHHAGLVHRDVKPGNIMLTTTGVKLLDFGVAKRHLVAPNSTRMVDTPSRKEGPVGTLFYMAPEQLAGSEVDHRADIWSFGCVLFEMLTGRRAFTGKTMTEVIAAIVTEAPLVMNVERGVVPLALQHVVARCLARDPSQRWQTVDDFARELLAMLPHATPDPQRPPTGSLSQVSPAGLPEEPRRPGRLRKAWIAAGVLTFLLLATAAWFLGGRQLVGL
jgi:serine/threonine protein kinase